MTFPITEEHFVKYDSVKHITPEEYFKGSHLSINTFKNKYLIPELGEKNPAHVFKRVADYAASAETDPAKRDYWAKRWFHEMWTGQWMAAGSILQGAGNPNKVSLSNCTTLGFGGDTLEDIFDCAYQVAKVAAYRQGLGVHFDLRAKGMKVGNSSKISSGNTHWMKYINEIGNYVGQSGRIPAMLFSISDSNPDLLDFITIKSDQKTISNANISVQFSDAFMKCLEEDGIWKMKYSSVTGEVFEKEEKASVIFSKFVENNWSFAEPGAQFIDTAHKYSNSDYLDDERFVIKSTNACIPDFALLLTKNGIRQLKDLNIGDEIWSGKNWTKIKRKWKTGHKPVYKYLTTCSSFIGTNDHKIFQYGERCEVKNAQSIDWAIGDPNILDVDFDSNAVMAGLMIGDGGVHKASNNLCLLYIGLKDQDYFKSEISHLIGKHRPAFGVSAYEAITDITYDELPHTYLRSVPDRYFYGDEKSRRSFLRGLFSANGTISGNRVCLKQTSFVLIEQVQIMLSSLGIKSYVSYNKGHEIEFSNGFYHNKDSYDINILAGKEIFAKHIGFIQSYKTDRLSALVESKHKYFSSDIRETAFIGNLDVWDIEVEDENHSFWCNGSLISNCSEQFLENLKGETAGLCVLSSTNYMYLFRKFGSDIQKACEYLRHIVARSVNRFLDNIVTKEIEDNRYPIIEQLNSLKLLRRTGAGIANLDGYLIYNNIGYDTDEGIETIYKLTDAFNLGLYESSIALGEEKGSFGAFKRESYIKSPFIKQMMDRHGLKFETMRNVCVSSVAPTGSLASMFLDLISYGIEPIMGLYYWKRNRTSGKWEWSFFVPSFVREILSKKGIDLGMEGDSIPDDENGSKGEKIAALIEEHFPKGKFKPAHLINPFKKVELMGKLTRECIDSSISVTYNLPEDVSKETIRDLYIYAWKQGVKSISIYRDKSRFGVVEFESPRIASKRYEQSEEQKNEAVLMLSKRPKELDADCYQVTVKGEKWIAFVGKYDNRPYEIFAGRQDEISLPSRYKTGKILKDKKNYYFISGEEDDEIKVNITKSFTNDEHSALTRQMSLNLRHGTPLIYIIDQLDKSHGTIVDYSKVLMRVLKNYLSTEDTAGKLKCQDCGSRDLVYQEKCFVCNSCGSSKCG